MLYTDNTAKLLDLQDFEVEKIEENEKEKRIFGKLHRHEQYCPCCGAATGTIHDYRLQQIKDLTILGKRCIIMLVVVEEILSNAVNEIVNVFPIPHFCFDYIFYGA